MNSNNHNDLPTFTLPLNSEGSGIVPNIEGSGIVPKIQVAGNSQLLDVQFKQPVNAGKVSSPGGGKAPAPSKVKAKDDVDSASNDYLKRRSRNNIAVKKSREKSKQKDATTAENIERLKEENVELEEKVEVLSKELAVLKKLFMDHAKGFSATGSTSDLPDLKQLEKLLGHKLTDKSSATNSDDFPSTSS